jgi:hypothetical protein
MLSVPRFRREHIGFRVFFLESPLLVLKYGDIVMQPMANPGCPAGISGAKSC